MDAEMLLFMRSARFWLEEDGGTALDAALGLNGCLATEARGGSPSGASKTATEATGGGEACAPAGFDAGVFLGGSRDGLLGVEEAEAGVVEGEAASGGAEGAESLVGSAAGLGGFMCVVASLISRLAVLDVLEDGGGAIFELEESWGAVGGTSWDDSSFLDSGEGLASSLAVD